MAKTLDDIFDDDDFGLLNQKEKVNNTKSDEVRMIDAFEEINSFYAKNIREPEKVSMSEYNLYARLKEFQTASDQKKKILKPFDRFNLLGHVEMESQTVDEILDDDDLGLLNSDADQSIYEFKHTPKITKRADADFVAQRTAMPDAEFADYENMFIKVHEELKSGARKLVPFENMEKNLQIGNFYLLDGMLLYLESGELETAFRDVKSGGRVRTDGRTLTVFENATKSNMLYRSLGKVLQKNGKIITKSNSLITSELESNSGVFKEEGVSSGWIYILKSKSIKPEITSLKNLYKIGFSSLKVADRIKNASKEATYLYSDVEIIATYACYDLNIKVFENLIHRFFAQACLNVDIYDFNGQRYVPREWFIVPFEVIDEAIQLLINGSIVNYQYNNKLSILELR
jgi:hypothetical protein